MPADDDTGASAASAGTTSSSAANNDNNTAAQERRRLLRDVEADERRVVYDALYKSLDGDATSTAAAAAAQEPSVHDTVRSARAVTDKLLHVATMPLSQKAAHCSALMRQLGERRHTHVLRLFVYVSVAMLTLPLVALCIGMYLVAPRMQLDATLCGGFAAVATATSIAAGYTAYAVYEERQTRQAAAHTTVDTMTAQATTTTTTTHDTDKKQR